MAGLCFGRIRVIYSWALGCFGAANGMYFIKMHMEVWRREAGKGVPGWMVVVLVR